jgi:hypothetical protein
VLSGLLRRIHPDGRAMNCETADDLDAFMARVA